MFLCSCQVSFIGSVIQHTIQLYASLFYQNREYHIGPLLFPVPREHCHLTKPTLFQTHSTANVYEGHNPEASGHLFSCVSLTIYQVL